MTPPRVFTLALGLTFASASSARADTAQLFGFGPRSASLARADIAAGEGPDATRVNAALAAIPGVRVRLGYGYGALGLRFDGKDAGVGHASGVDLAGQLAKSVGRGVDLGIALGLHLPDSYLARIGFRPATEPQFVLYESPLQRTTFDLVAAGRLGPVSIGAGATMGLSVGGNGTRFELSQDAHGPRADGAVDVALPFRFAPIIGVQADLGRVALGVTFRGAMALDLGLVNSAKIALQDNPLNGTTKVTVSGSSGYDPAVLALGARVAIAGGLSAMGSIELGLYGAAPPPVADVQIDVHLGTTPGLRHGQFVEPRFRNTLTPRLGLELRRPSADDWRWAARVGYAVAPSPVPHQNGLTTYADATRHQMALGGGYHFGKLAGVDLSLAVAGQLHVLAPRTDDKDNPSLPYAHFEVAGTIVHGSAALEAAW